MFLNDKKSPSRAYQPSTKIIAGIVMLSLSVLWLFFYCHQQLSAPEPLIQIILLAACLCIIMLVATCLLTLEMLHSQKKQQAKLAERLSATAEQFIELEKKLSFNLNHDLATGLPNKNALEQYLHKIIKTNQTCAIFSISINNLYFISDSYGTEIIDELLTALVARFSHILEKKHLLARVDADKLMIVCPAVSELSAEMTAHQLYNSLVEEFVIQEQEVILHCAIGISCNHSQQQSATALFQQANMALRKAKNQLQGKIALYHSSIQQELDEKKNYELALKYAISNNELSLHYQPQVDLRSKRIVGAEVLIRWQDRKGNNVMPPCMIIKTAEKAGLMLALGHWVMETALKQYATLLDERCAPAMLSINASGIEFKDGSFVEHIHRTLSYYDIPASRVQIELSEQAFAHDIDHIVLTLKALSELGITLAINDFGTGYLSLYYLKQLPIDTLKIDPSFIENLSHSKDDMVICQTIITMANLLQMKVVSVGIEDCEQQAMLQNIGCHFAQGQFLHPPMCFDKLTTLLKKQRESMALSEII